MYLALRIHITEDSRELLKSIGGYRTQSRGQIEVKAGCLLCIIIYSI